MNQYALKPMKQLGLFEGGIEMRKQAAKRVNIVSLKLIRESSLMYKGRCVRSPEDGYKLLKQFLGDVDREYFVVVCLDTKNQPTAINICHIGSLNASIVHPRECFKPAILRRDTGTGPLSQQPNKLGESSVESEISAGLFFVLATE